MSTPEASPEPVPGGADLARNTLVMAAGTLLSRLTGFLRVAALSYAFGVTESKLADAYNVANVTPNIVYELVLGGVLSSVLVPVFVETLRRDHEEHRHVVNAVTTVAGTVLVLISTVAIFAAPLIARVLTLGAEGGGEEAVAMRQTVTLFLRLFLPQVLFYGLITIWTAYLNAHRHFGAPMFAPVLNNLVVAAVVLAFGFLVGFEPVDLETVATAPLLLVGVGTTLGIVAMTFPLWPVSRRHGWRWRPSLDWRHPMVRRVGRLGVWTVLYVVTNQIGYFVVVVLTGAMAVPGGFAAYTYAFVFFQLPHGIYAVSVMTALLPALAAAASDDDLGTFRRELTRGVRVTALVIFPSGLGLAVLATPIVRLLLEHGVFTASSTVLVSRTLTAFALGLASFSLFQLFLRAFYALQDTRSPVLVNVGAVGVNILLDVVLFLLLPTEWKVPGLALGHAIAYTVGALLFAVLLRRRLRGLQGRETAGQLGRVVAAAALMSVVVWAVARAVASALGTATLAAQLATVAASVFAGGSSYFALATLFRVEDLATLVRLIRRRLVPR
ncbi:MAG: murein biosynthesis integral membrane protein MurJ [Actinomycetota bacterium]|nr:murein biosynthesis integral membrane protein MurJ [Actinomycetota bacterium]